MRRIAFAAALAIAAMSFAPATGASAAPASAARHVGAPRTSGSAHTVPTAVTYPSRARLEYAAKARFRAREAATSEHRPPFPYRPGTGDTGGGSVWTPATPPPVFGAPIELAAPPDAVAGPEGSFLSAVSCTSLGNCVAVGQYNNSAGGYAPMILTETRGVWDTPQEVTLPPDAADPAAQFSALIGVECTSLGNCVAVGQYFNTDGNGQLLVVTETHGVWGVGIAPKLPANAMTEPGSQYAWLNQLDCPAPGNCVATGGYAANGASMNGGGLVVTEHGGVWARAIQIALPPNATTATSGPKNPAAGTTSMGGVSCLSVGNCVAEGQYTDTNFNSQPMIATETDGAWSRAIELALPANAATATGAQNGFLANLVCFRAGDCEVGAGYNDLDGNAQPAYFRQARGVWKQGVELTIPANAATAPGTQSAYLNGFECTSPGNCVAFAAYIDVDGSEQPLAITETGGVWARGLEPPLPSNAMTTGGAQDANIYGMSCSGPGLCAAVGNYVDSDGNLQAMAYATKPARQPVCAPPPANPERGHRS